MIIRATLLILGICVCLFGMAPANAGLFSGSLYHNYVYSPPGSLASVPPAVCGPGSSPEDGLQGEVPLADRQSGRSLQGYNCNLTLIGRYQGAGASWVDPSYGTCAYMAAAFPAGLLGKYPGTSVIDVSNPANPVLIKVLESTAMQSGPWESLKVNPTRNLLAAISGGPGVGLFSFDVYNISNCAEPLLLNGVFGTTTTFPANLLGHEGNWSPDGKTYWSSGLAGGLLTAIDVSNPALPHLVFEGTTGLTNHGFSLSADGNRMYIGTAAPAGVQIFDTSQIQKRALIPLLHFVSSISWTDGLITQATIPVTYSGHPYIIAFDEGGSGAVRFIDIANELHPIIVSQIKLAIDMPDAVNQNQADIQGNGLFGYDAHYCEADNNTNPTALACGWFQSGIRVFDIRNPLSPKEIAYFNPPAQAANRAILTNSEHVSGVAGHAPPVLGALNANLPTISGLGTEAYGGTNPTLTTDWCSSPPRFVGNQLWVTCQDNGLLILGFTNGAFPLQ